MNRGICIQRLRTSPFNRSVLVFYRQCLQLRRQAVVEVLSHHDRGTLRLWKRSLQRRRVGLVFYQFCLALASPLPNSTEMSITTSRDNWFVVLLANRLQVFVRTHRS